VLGYLRTVVRGRRLEVDSADGRHPVVDFRACRPVLVESKGMDVMRSTWIHHPAVQGQDQTKTDVANSHRDGRHAGDPVATGWVCATTARRDGNITAMAGAYMKELIRPRNTSTDALEAACRRQCKYSWCRTRCRSSPTNNFYKTHVLSQIKLAAAKAAFEWSRSCGPARRYTGRLLTPESEHADRRHV